MALPTLPSYWCSQQRLSQQLARQREQEARLRQQWEQNSRYFRMSDICSSKQAEWSSKTSYQRSMHAYQREKMKEEKRKSLEVRREKLRQLMQEEQDLLARELEELRLSMNLRERRVREQHRNLKSAREEQRKLIAEQLLYEHWKKNNPRLREMELDLHQKHVVNSWEMQKEEKKQQEATAEQENKRYENQYEKARREALERMKAEEERRQLEDKLQAEALLQQMEELKLKEVEATKLKKEQENLLKQQWELDRLEEERKQMEAFREKAELGRFLRHQYNAQLNRRTQQIQEELEADRRILQALLEKEDESQRLDLAKRERAVADAAWMKQAIEEQLQLERAREAELQMLLREEAKEMWEKREAEWARERSARDRLMSEVLTGRQQQIQEKIEQNRRAQEESLKHREQLIRNLEEARESARREKEESEDLKSARKRELEAQVAERRLQAWEADQQEEEEEEESRRAEQLSDALLQQEAKTMAEQGYQPKVGSLPGDGPPMVTQTPPSPCSVGLFITLQWALLSSHPSYSLFLFCIPLYPDQQGALMQGLFQSLVGSQTALELILLWPLPTKLHACPPSLGNLRRAVAAVAERGHSSRPSW
ncbi:trichoplein keratin filament-binding protein isoform X1 [Saimiri boliviensis]|uniref:Trichoplein keratin filament-binding protein n=1 Tax=Saimiri boliviensis boliviensis TaxID=39432 RepID=A0A2K6UCV1_SAIBB|nr:trichoplein keratin filament-binding protein isoform X1 [Saimiri boliviensis boliviensis]XP_039327741.1 trichoplein keratin filament-binding protein isoform X1 [Saimiri boliviensis boliviensis]